MAGTSGITDEIIRLLGGAGNILTAANCMTRLRITVSDESAVDEDQLKRLEGVLGVVHDREKKFEIVVGPGKCRKYADELRARGIGASADGGSEEVPAPEKRSVKALMKVVGDIFVPMIPGVITAGLCAGFASLLTQVCPDYEKSGQLTILYNLLTLISTSFMTYMTAWVGYRAAERFGATPIIGGMLGMLTSLDGINKISLTLGLYNEDAPLSSVLCAGKGGVLSVIFGVYLLSLIEKKLRPKILEAVDIIVTPFLSLVLCVIPYILIIMPVFGFASSGIAWVLSRFCFSESIIVRMIVGYVSAAFFLPLVATGMHHGLVALYTVQLQEIGYVTLYPALSMAGAGQVGAAIAVMRKAKKLGDQRLVRTCAGGIPTGILGIGEPLIYGVTLPLGKPFITAGFGAGFGGAFVMAMQVASTTWGPSGVLGVFVMTAGPNGAVKNVLVYLGGLVISYIGGFVLTALTLKDKDLSAGKAHPPADESAEKKRRRVVRGESFGEGSLTGLCAPVDGELVPMDEIPDPTFAEGTLGECVGFLPENGEICAPCGGTAMMIADTKHAVTIETDDGSGILVHAGIDTVKLGGRGFEVKISEGVKITAGQLIMKADLGVIREAGLSPMVIVAKCE